MGEGRGGGRGVGKAGWREAVLSLAWVRSAVGEERIADLVRWGGD